jgi:enoyl-CoA hydratase/carnithine racemase
VNRVVAPEELAHAVGEYARTIAAKSPVAIRLGKQAVYAQAPMSLADAYELTSRVMVENMLTEDAAEGIAAFLDKRQPEWRGK